MTERPVKTAVIGCGMISGTYLRNCASWPMLDMVACADLDTPRAQNRAAEFGIPRVLTVDDMLLDPEIELIVNLTIPSAHGEIALAAVRAGKSVYNEKPLTLDRDEGQLLLKEARSRGVRVGCAPDTSLGGGLQTARKVIDDGVIGRPVGAMAHILTQGPDYWHPDPAFFYQRGAGPLFDVGPYYLTALIAMLGPIGRVTGSARISHPERSVGSGPKAGQKIVVETPTHVAAVLDFESGPTATLVTSFDVSDPYLPSMTIYGSDATIVLPDPNTFGGPVLLRRRGTDELEKIPLTHAHAADSRGIGVADMAAALRSDRPHRASGTIALHVLDVMHGVLESSEQGRHVTTSTTCERPQVLSPGLSDYQLDHRSSRKSG